MRDPLHRLSVKFKLAFGFVGLCVGAFGIGGFFISSVAQTALTDEIMARLDFQSQAYATDLHASLEMLTRRSEDFASDGYIREHLASMVSETDEVVIAQLKKELHRHLRVNKLPLEPAFMDLAVVSAVGEMQVAVLDETSDTALHLAKWSITQETSASSEVLPGSASRSPGLVVATPILGLRSGQPIGRLLATIRAGVWVTLAMRNARIGRDRTMEDVGLRLYDNSGGCLVVPPRFLNYGADGTMSLQVQEGQGLAVLGPSEVHNLSRAGVRGQDVFRKQFPIGNSGWNAEVSIHSQRALAPVSSLQSDFFFVGLVLAAASIFLLYFPLRYLAKPMAMLRDAALSIREGDFSTRVEVDSEDEVGDLAKSFNLMAAAVESRNAELEKNAADLRERQLEVLAQRDRLDRVISTLRDGLVVFGANGEVLLSNRAAKPLLEFIRQTQGGAKQHRNRRQCPSAQIQLEDHGCELCLGGTNFDKPQTCMLEFGDRIFDIHATPLPLGESGDFGRILSARDITLRVARDEREIHQERLVVLGEVAAVMAHELNNPLASISMFNQLMEAKLPADSELHENIDVIKRNTETCKRVIGELLSYANDTTPELSLVDIHSVLQDVGRFLRPVVDRSRVALNLELESENPWVMGDEVQLRQIFVNLVMNATQAVAAGGKIDLKSFDQGSQLIIAVRDTGSGIPADAQKNIFRAFFTTKARGEGTGLGLPTAKRIAELHGGGIELMQSDDQGTLFHVRLRPSLEVSA
ncbi:MAG: HAMP domain-containing protein [Planctomycetes bacterium]|nr:HAMP domain-containing protein [Planctomycetota bacterium]